MKHILQYGGCYIVVALIATLFTIILGKFTIPVLLLFFCVFWASWGLAKKTSGLMEGPKENTTNKTMTHYCLICQKPIPPNPKDEKTLCPKCIEIWR